MTGLNLRFIKPLICFLIIFEFFDSLFFRHTKIFNLIPFAPINLVKPLINNNFFVYLFSKNLSRLLSPEKFTGINFIKRKR